MKKSEVNKQIPKVLIPIIRNTLPEIVQSEIIYVKDDDTFTLKPLDKPIIVYTFRGHILE